MNRQEIQTEVRKRLNDNAIEMHERIVRMEVYLEQLVGNGDEGKCQKHEDSINSLKRIFWMVSGGGAVLIFFVKYIL